MIGMECSTVSRQKSIVDFFKKPKMPKIDDSSQSRVVQKVDHVFSDTPPTMEGGGASLHSLECMMHNLPGAPPTSNEGILEEERLKGYVDPKTAFINSRISRIRGRWMGNCSVCLVWSQIVVFDTTRLRIYCTYCSIALAEKRKSWIVLIEERPEVEVVVLV